MGEVGLGDAARLRRLAEDDVALGSVQRPPPPHPPLQGAPDTIVREGQRAQALKVAQQGDGLQGAVLLQQGKEVILPIAFEGIGHRAAVNGLAVRGRGRVGIEPAGRALAEPGARRRCALSMLVEVGRGQSHLLVGDGFAGQPGSSV